MEQTKLRSFAKAVYKARQDKLNEIRKKEEEKKKKIREDAENYASMCIQIFASSTESTDNLDLWVKEVRIFEEDGHLCCVVGFQKQKENETWSTTTDIKNSVFYQDLQYMVEIMENFEILTIEPTLTLEYMAELLKNIPYFESVYSPNTGSIVIAIQEIVVDEKD